MPAASLWSTTKIQQKLMYGIQDVIVSSTNRIYACKSLLGVILVAVDLIVAAYRLRKLGRPTHANVNQHNSHVLIDLRDWFLEHDRSARRIFYEVFFNLVIIKYEFDGHMGRRLEKWLEKWYEAAQSGKWIFTHKHPETEWELDEEDKKEPTYLRQQALQQALDNEEYDKALNLIE